MRIVGILGLLAGSIAAAQTPAGRLWDELKAKREKLVGVHQEFEVVTTIRTGTEDQLTRR